MSIGYEKAPDLKIRKLISFLERYSEQSDLNFMFGNKELTAEDVFAHTGGLALFVVEAKEIYEKIYNNIYTALELTTQFYDQAKQKEITYFIPQEQLDLDKKLTLQLPVLKKFPIELVEQKENTFFDFIVRESKQLDVSFSDLTHFTLHALDSYMLQNEFTHENKKYIQLEPLYLKMAHKINTRELKIINSKNAKLIYPDQP